MNVNKLAEVSVILAGRFVRSTGMRMKNAGSFLRKRAEGYFALVGIAVAQGRLWGAPRLCEKQITCNNEFVR